MPKTFLQMVNEAEEELGLTASPSVFGATGTVTSKQLGRLANRTLDELRRAARWTAMQNEFDFRMVPPVTTTGDMAAGSNVITNIPSTAAISADSFMVAGQNIPNAARVESVDSATQVTLSMWNTSTTPLVGITLQFMQDTYDMPTDFDWFNNRTMWDRTNQWELLGPDSPQQDQWQRSGIVPLTPRRHWRKIGPKATSFRLWPPPAEIVAPLQLVFEYMTINAVAEHGNVNNRIYEFTNDDDTCLLDEQAIIMGMKWMFWEIKGFGSYVTMQTRWVDYVDRLTARDGGAPTLSMAKSRAGIFISPAQVQDGNFPGRSD